MRQSGRNGRRDPLYQDPSTFADSIIRGISEEDARSRRSLERFPDVSRNVNVQAEPSIVTIVYINAINNTGEGGAQHCGSLRERKTLLLLLATATLHSIVFTIVGEAADCNRENGERARARALTLLSLHSVGR